MSAGLGVEEANMTRSRHRPDQQLSQGKCRAGVPPVCWGGVCEASVAGLYPPVPLLMLQGRQHAAFLLTKADADSRQTVMPAHRSACAAVNSAAAENAAVRPDAGC